MEKNHLYFELWHFQTALCCSGVLLERGFAVNSHKLSAVGSQFRLAALSLLRKNTFHGLLTIIIIIHFYFTGEKNGAGELRQSDFRG